MPSRASCRSSGVSRESPDHASVARGFTGGSFPGLTPLALPYPGHRRLGGLGRRLVLAVAPVTAPALFVMRGPAGRADHGAIIKVPAGFLTVSQAPRFAARRPQPAPTGVPGPHPGLAVRATAKLPQAAGSGASHGMAASAVRRAGAALRRRWHGASGGAVRRPSPPHSGRPRCRTFLAGKRHR